MFIRFVHEFFGRRIADEERAILDMDIIKSSLDDRIPEIRARARRRLLIELRDEIVGGTEDDVAT